MDRTSNSVITQALDLSICFPTGETQNLTFGVTLLDQGCTIVLGFHWLTRFNPLIDWVLGRIIFRQSSQPEAKTLPPVKTLSSAPTPALPNPIPDPETPLPPVKRKPPQVTLINASAFARTCKLKDTQRFQLRISVPETTGHSATTSALVDLSTLPEEYHDFADMFSKSTAGKLADH